MASRSTKPLDVAGELERTRRELRQVVRRVEQLELRNAPALPFEEPDIFAIARSAPVVERIEDLAAPDLFKSDADFERFRAGVQKARRENRSRG